MRRWILFGVAAVVLVLLAMPLAAIYYVAYTEEGLELVVSHIPERVGRARISVSGASGTIGRSLHIDRLEIEHERVHLRLEDIQGRIQLRPLLLQTLRSPEITVRSALVEIRRRKTPVPKYEPRFLPRALKIRADSILVTEATLVVPNGRRFDLTNVRTSGVAQHKLIRLFKAEGTMDALHIDADGKLRAADPLQIEGAVRAAWRPHGQPAWIVDATAEGDLDELAINSQLTAPFRADFAGRALELTGPWHWEGQAKVHDFDIRTWGASGMLGRIAGELAIRGDAKGFEARGPLTPEGLKAGAFDVSFQGSYANRTVTADRIELTHQGSGASATGSGSIQVVENGPRLDLQGDWHRFRWPLVGKAASVRSETGQYVLQGVWPYDIRAAGMIETQSLAPIPFTMTGQLDKGRVLVTEGSVQIFDGEASVTAAVTWSPQQTWAASGLASSVNPVHLRKDLPGKLTFAFEASGEGFGPERNFTLRVQRLNGQLRNLLASGAGTISHRDATWYFHNIRGRLGGTEVALDGQINGQFDLRFALETQDLGLLAQDSRGRLHAEGTVRGTVEEPVVDAVASGSGIRHKGVSLGNFEASIDFDPHRAGKSTVDIRAKDISYGERTIEQLRLALDGAAVDHVVRMNAAGPGFKIQSQAQGGYIKGVWQGQLTGLSVNGSESLHLDLERPIAMTMSAKGIRVERLCLHGSPAHLCAEGEWNPQQWTTTVVANDLPMSTLTAGLTPGVEYKGILSMTAQAFGSAAEPVQGKLRVDLREAQLAHRLASGRTETITLGTGVVTANATAGSITGELNLDAGPVGAVKGSLTAARTSTRWRDMPIAGELHAHTAELDFLGLYVPEIDRAAGSLTVDLDAGGTVGSPLIDGTVKLANGELDLYQINLGLRGMSMEARLANSGLDFSGSARVGTGSAYARGRLTWRNSLPYGRFTLTGENLRVVNVPEAQIDASPNLDFRIDGRRISVSGRVRVPQARIVPADLTNAVRTSSDEIIISELAVPTQRFEVVSNIRLTLGDRVEIDTSGLKGRLAGSITVRSGYEEITRATGDLNVEGGEYTAYGRRLDIERGRLIFTGGPVGDPGVDIRAVKKFPDVVAGINVRGTLRQPRMTFFSEPSLPQTQIVQLILAGGTMQSAQNSRNGRGNGAGNELLAQGGAILAQQIGSRVGIEDVSLESTLSNETSIVLGKYLSPRFYVSYGIGLTEQLNTLKLRYTLGDHWTIRTEYGEEGGADLVYTIDK